MTEAEEAGTQGFSACQFVGGPVCGRMEAVDDKDKHFDFLDKLTLNDDKSFPIRYRYGRMRTEPHTFILLGWGPINADGRTTKWNWIPFK
jgi:hypothetical protein